MDSSLINLSQHSPNDTLAVESSSSLPHHMDDAEPLTRKRPRLDSGEQARRNMSTDQMGSPSLELISSPQSEREHTEQSDTEPIVSQLPPTPTKVTLNLRENPLISSHIPPDSVLLENQSIVDHGGNEGVEATPHTTSSDSETQTSTHGSPEIQVAEVEDIGEEPGETRWQPLRYNTNQARVVQQDVLSRFPFIYENSKTWSKNFAPIAKLIETSDLKEGEVFERLTEWIELYLNSNASMSATWRDTMLEDRDFWDELPTVMEAILSRSDSNRSNQCAIRIHSEFGPHDRLDSMSRFFKAWAALSLRMTQIDCQILQEAATELIADPDLVSERYVQSLSVIIRPDCNVWKRFLYPDIYDSRIPLLAMISQFLNPDCQGLTSMIDLVTRIMDRPGSLPKLISKFHSHFIVICQIGQSYLHATSSGFAGHTEPINPSLYNAFISLTSRMDTMIKKQVQGFSMQLCSSLIMYLNLLLHSLTYLDETWAEQLLEEKGLQSSNLSVGEKSDLLRLSWKFETLRSGIMEGRMEIRVMGVEMMQNDLLEMHGKYMEHKVNGSEEAIPRFLAHFLIRHSIVPYLLGPESHVQLTARAHNILGFLVVTGRLTEKDIDDIWNLIFSMQETRSSESLQPVLVRCLGLCSLPALLYLLEKCTTIPIQNMDPQTREFAANVLGYTAEKLRSFPADGDAQASIAPFQYCLAIIRKSAPDSTEGVVFRRELNGWAMQQLNHFLNMNSSRQIRETLANDCVDDIARSGASSTGSISVLTTLAQNSRTDIWHDLLQEVSVTSLLIESLQGMVDRARRTSLDPAISHECLMTHLRLLELLLIAQPESVAPDAAESLWEYLVGSKAVDDIARNCAWNTLIGVLRGANQLNGFVERCVSHFYLQLSSEYIISGCLDFVDSARPFLSQTTLSEENEEPRPTASELIWHLCMTIPPQAMEMGVRAIDMLVKNYLDSPDARSRTREATDHLHIELVDRCMGQLKLAASRLRSFTDGTVSGENSPMIVVATEDQVQSERSNFARSATILSEFVRGVRARPMYSPSPETSPKIPRDFDRIKGAPLSIKYQTFAEGKKNGEIRTFQVGELETVKELFDRLLILSGFSAFQAICCGRRIDFEGLKDSTLRDAEFAGKGLILVQKTASGASSIKNSTHLGLRPMEMEILRHFDDLYSFLEMENALAFQVYAFLIEFPPDPKVMKNVLEQPCVENVFPNTKPYKYLYSIHALRFALEQKAHMANFGETLIYATNKLTEALENLHVNHEINVSSSESMVIEATIACLGTVIKSAHDLPSLSKADKEDLGIAPHAVKELMPSRQRAETLLNQCGSIILRPLTPETPGNAQKLVYDAFAVLLEGCATSANFWSALRASDMIESLIKRLLLQETRMANRQLILKLLRAAVRSQSEHNSMFQAELVGALTTGCLSLTSEILPYAANSEQLFETTLLLLNSCSVEYRQSIAIDTYVNDWLSKLISHCHTEVVGRNEVDFLANGLARLCIWCLHLSRSLDKSCDVPMGSATRLFQSQLFPEIHDLQRMPNLNSNTREQLYILTLALSNESDSLSSLLRLVHELNLDREDGSQAWSWGFASKVEDIWLADPNWSIERNKITRAAAGHCGLRNLSNTCYMNSLFTQLFMNVEFRHYVINLDISDCSSSQKLLYEIRSLFSYMQDSALKAVDTSDIAESIVTYENVPVDVTHQVDVDEFFNLLFDRLESQIVDAEDKRRFRGFYGGHIVQQIKSRECSHISERLEPFSAIQCDIAGKSNLIESLNAYVQGESMEGDNKYSCTSCSKYVDAVKRACLKDLPQNLIFHLKRFDYDLMNGTRKKINERFEFPFEIDMAPYKLDYLVENGKTSEPDLYSLVGVLVHSGNAESGHYYSYVQERSGNARGKWVEFNDADVSEFNPAEIDSSSFGGWHDVMPGYEPRFPKLWNAYMLFYERLPTTSGAQCGIIDSWPPRVHLTEELQSNIGVDNQAFLRSVCQHDPAHFGFIKNLLRQSRTVHPGSCTPDHLQEKLVIEVVLEYLAEFLARVKETSLFEDVLMNLNKTIGSCRECSNLALRWLTVNESHLGDLMLKCPHPKIRRETSAFVINALQKSRQPPLPDDDTRVELSSTATPVNSSARLRKPCEVLSPFLERLKGFWGNLHTCIRAWDDFFGLLVEISSMGINEHRLIMRHGFFEACLELIVCDHPVFKNLRNHQPYLTYSKMLDKGRKMQHAKFLELFAGLLERMDLAHNPTSLHSQNRPIDGPRFILTDQEFQYVYQRTSGSRGYSVFLDRVLNMGGNYLALKRIVRFLMLAEPEAEFHPIVYCTIKHGIPVEPAHLAQPFLRAALIYCECTPSIASAVNLITSIAEEMNTIGDSGGREHLDFFAQVRRVRSLRDAAPSDVFYKAVISTASCWAPPLLLFWDPEVRTGASDLLRQVYFQHDLQNMDDEELADRLIDSGKALCKFCVVSCNRSLLEGRPIARLMDEIIFVIKMCVDRYFSLEEDELFVSDANDLIDRLQALAVSDVEDQVSEIVNNSDVPTDSDSETYPNSPL